MILVSKYIVPRGYTGIAIFPFVFVKHSGLKENERFINHERIHLRQQLELFVLPFFLWYGIEFLVRYAYYKNWSMAYRSISFEREAYAQEDSFEYLKSRPFWSFLNYL